MEKIINIGSKEVRLDNNVGWLMEYRDQFGKDAAQELIPLVATLMETLGTGLSAYKNGRIDLEELAESVEGHAFEMLMPLYNAELSILIINVTWAMAKSADPTILPPKQWVKQFESFYFDEMIPQIWELVVTGSVSSKNLKGLSTLIGKAKEAMTKMGKAQPSHLMTSSSPDSSED